MQKNIQSPYAPALRLAELNRWSEGERLLIQYCRVERTLRNSFFNNEWRQISMFHQDRLNPLFFCLNHSPLSLNFHLLSSDGRPLVLDWFLSEPQERQNSHAHYPFADVLEILSISPDYDPAVLSVTELDEYRRMHELFPCVMTVSLVKHFSEYFKISNALDSAWIQEKQVVKPVDAVLQSANWQQCPTIIFHGRENAPQFFLHQRICGERVLLLPVVFFLYDFLPDIVFPMYEIPYSDKVPFYNADMIAANPGSTIILSDELAVSLVNDSSKDCVFTSWYGGMEAASKLDFALLAGHPVELLCFERRNAQNEKENVIRINELAGLAEQHQISVKILVCDEVTWTEKVNAAYCFEGVYKKMRRLSVREFRSENNLGVCDKSDYHVYTLDELKKLPMPEFVLFPVLMRGYYTLIYGGSGVAKTWFSLHLALSVSQGKNPFPNWELRSGALSVLYVAGEMSPEIYGDRLRSLEKGDGRNDNFHFIRKNYNISETDDQIQISEIVNREQVQMIVFDNLTTLAENGHLESNFSKILNFFSGLQKERIIVILIHHENRQGGFKGTAKITDIADQSIHLYSGGKSDKIEVLVQGDKIRNVSKAAQQSFHATFDFAGNGEWVVSPLSEFERNLLDEDDPLDMVGQNIGKKRNDHSLAWRFMNTDEKAQSIIGDVLSGCNDDVIAANLAVRENVIQNFREEYRITDDMLKHLLMIIKPKDERKPESLAKDIWKILKKQNEAETGNLRSQSERLSGNTEIGLENGGSADILQQKTRSK